MALFFQNQDETPVGPSQAQIDEINFFRTRCDSKKLDWKEELSSLWMSGNYARQGIDRDTASVLQQVRNQWGPQWLESVTDEDLDGGIDGDSGKPVEYEPARQRG